MKLIQKILGPVLLVLILCITYPTETQASKTYYKGDVIEINSQEPIDRLYILWDTIPGEWTLSVDGQEFTYGTYDYLHEYVEPGISGYNWQIKIKSEKVILGKMYSYTVSQKLDDFVQIWEPPCKDADMLVFPTHADDEVLFFGGTLP